MGRYLLVLVALCSGAAAAQELQPTRVAREHYDVTLAADGSSVTIIDVAKVPQSPGGVQAASRVQLGYQEGSSEIEILEAYTQKADGKRVPVQADRILTQVPPAIAQAPAFSDGKVKVLIFPDVAVGDQVVYRAIRRERKPNFPGQFSDIYFFPRAVIFDDVLITIRHPASLTLNVDTRELKELPAYKEKGLQVREWRYRNLTATLEERGAVDVLDRDPRLLVTTFRSWAEVANAYEARAADKARVTDEIRRKAREIVGARTTPLDKAQALYDWVASNVRYVAVYLGAGGYVPHAAEEVLRSSYGDCKDQVTLLSALLAAEGIDSTPVLLSAGPRYQLASVASPQLFNHVILWLPEPGVFLDTTARVLPFGELGDAVMDKSVLPTRGFKELLRTPMGRAETNTALAVTTVRISDSGAATGESRIQGKGQFGAALRAALQNAPAGFESRVISGGFASEGMSGTGTLTREISGPASEGAGATMKFETANWANLPGPGAMKLPSNLFGLITARGMALGALASPPAKVAHTCMPVHMEETLNVELPASLKVRVPDNVSFANPVARYEARYELKGTLLTATRTVTTLYAHANCPPEDVNAFREVAEVMRRDTAAQLLY
jgi:transglutaminase-like putative cysteine protease